MDLLFKSGLKTFHIFLNDSPSLYSHDQGVSGGVVINPGTSAMETQGLLLTFKGNVSVHWVEHRGGGQGRSETRHYHGFSSIFDYEIYLVGDGNGMAMLSPGETVYPFNFPIDFANVPGSFKGAHGKVEYVLEVTLKRKGMFADCHTKRDVLVTPVLDLNLDPLLSQPKEWEASKNFCCLWCTSGPLTMIVKLGATGFCVGQDIPILVEVSNASTRKINFVSAQLIQDITYTARNNTKRIQERYRKESSGKEVGPGCSEVWRGNVHIPVSVVPTRLGGGCKIIDVQYHVEVVADASGPVMNLNLDLPVTIGTVPISKTDYYDFSSASGGFTFAPSAPP